MYNPEDINKSVFFLLKSSILQRGKLKIVKNCSILDNRKLGLAFKSKKLGSACLIKNLSSARQKVGSDPTLIFTHHHFIAYWSLELILHCLYFLKCFRERFPIFDETGKGFIVCIKEKRWVSKAKVNTLFVLFLAAGRRPRQL